MLCHVVFFAVVLGVVMAHPHGEGMPKCKQLMHGGMTCCKNNILPRKLPNDDIKECFQMPKKPPPSCEMEMCIAKKRGLASDDGTFDKAKMAEEVEKMFENDSDLIDSLKENCIDGDLSKYGPPDFCDLMKKKLCFDIQIIKSCKEWDDQGDCNGMKDLAAECVKG